MMDVLLNLIQNGPWHLLTDSRRLSFPEQTLFFALKTQSNDGHRYIADLYSLRVRHFVVSELPQEAESRFPEAQFFRVDDPLATLQELARHHRQTLHLPVVGITGSNGKTITKEFLFQLLHDNHHIVRSPRSYNSQIGVPLSVWQMQADHDLALIEAGISQPAEMQRLKRIIHPTYGILTGIGPAHQENFESLRQKLMEKLLLFHGCRALVYQADNALIRETVAETGLTPIAYPWSQTDPQAPVFVRVEVCEQKTHLQLTLEQKEEVKLTIPFTDTASIEDCLHALTWIACWRIHEQPGSAATYLQALADVCQRLEPVAMRLEVKQGRNNCLLINDSYNSDLQSLAIALEFQQSRKKAKALRPTLILSDILQSGIPKAELYRQVADLTLRKGIEKIIGIGPDLSQFAHVFQTEVRTYPSTEAFLNSDEIQQCKDELILIKGSRRFQFETITERLEKKVHETILEVNLNALIHNFNHYRSKLKPETKLIGMVKAFGYGAGSYELAKTLQEHHCDYLAVAVADEGVELRKEGITLPIIVMNPEFSSFQVLFEYQLEPEIYSFRLLRAFAAAAREKEIENFPIHIKFDTGMHRLGFQPKDVSELLSVLKEQSNKDGKTFPLRVSSVFSHLAGSDSPEFDDYTHQQITCFTDIAQGLENGLGHPIMKHILNSGGIERWSDHQLDAVRLGIGLYGVSASGQPGLKNVSTLKTTILQTQHIPKGETIGYSRRTRLIRDSRIAIIPIGYADGLDRHLSNGQGLVRINGQDCPIVGNICMDTCMIDVTDTQAREGDTVILFGDELPVQELANRLGTIPYEILTSVSPRVKRIYYQE